MSFFKRRRPKGFDPGDNENEDVYGPPEMFGLSPDPEEPEEDIDAPEDFDPDEDIIVALYGCPLPSDPDEDIDLEAEEKDPDGE